MQASPSSSWVLAAGLGVLSGLAGGFCGALLLADRGAPASAIPSQAPDGEVAAALRGFASEARLIREALEADAAYRASTPSSERAPVETPSTDRLEAAIERLAEVLANPTSAVQSRRADVPRRRKVLEPKSADRLLAICAMTEEERGRTYYFWSRQEFVDQFGSPDEVSVGGDSGHNVCFDYKIGEDRTIRFAFSNDLLYYIDCPN